MLTAAFCECCDPHTIHCHLNKQISANYWDFPIRHEWVSGNERNAVSHRNIPFKSHLCITSQCLLASKNCLLNCTAWGYHIPLLCRRTYDLQEDLLITGNNTNLLYLYLGRQCSMLRSMTGNSCERWIFSECFCEPSKTKLKKTSRLMIYKTTFVLQII